MSKNTTKGSEVNLKDSLAQLDVIVKWFGSQDEIDVEAGLDKIKEGAGLVKACKQRLSEIENEFEQIRREVEDDEGTSPIAVQKEAANVEMAEENIDPDNIPF